MKITVVGKGMVGGGLADLWEKAGHELTRSGRDGGDVSSAPDGFGSNVEFVKTVTGGPTAKSFNVNFATIYDQIANMSTPPGNIWCGDDEAREVVEQLSRDAGYDPIYAGGLQNAPLRESFLQLAFAIHQGGLGTFFYRMAPPDTF